MIDLFGRKTQRELERVRDAWTEDRQRIVQYRNAVTQLHFAMNNNQKLTRSEMRKIEALLRSPW